MDYRILICVIFTAASTRLMKAEQTNPTPIIFKDPPLPLADHLIEERENLRKNGLLFPEDNCEPFEPTPPNFTARNRRLSDAKCQEYTWQKMARDKQFERELFCILETKHSSQPKQQQPLDSKAPLPRIPVIAGGRDAHLGEFPHMGAIGWKAVSGAWLFMCGGSLISPRYVLSAAHCSAASPRDDRLANIVPKIVRLGHYNIIKTNETQYSMDANIDKIINHPLYKPPKKYYDIALVKLEQEVTFNDLIQPACLWTKPNIGPEVEGDRLEGSITGWGATKSGSYETPNHLQAADVDFIESGVCDRLLRSSRNRVWSGLQEHQLCAGKLEGGVDSCGGDSGGPVQIITFNGLAETYYIVGVTSFGIKCAYPNLPGIYTRVSSFVDWIETTVWS